MHTALPSLQTSSAWSIEDKPLPQLPSPTLSNIDMVLPMNALPTLSSPPRAPRRPPSPSYLRDQGRENPAPNSQAAPVGKKEKLGLMSRKMMLLRSRSASNGGTPRRSPSQGSIDFVPSSPILQDVGNLAPEQSEAELLQLPECRRRRPSGSSSSGLSGMTAYLEKHAKAGGGLSDDDLLDDSSEHATPMKVGRRDSLEEGAEELRRRQEQEEYESAILSQRAEHILANAKKRLNIMEGNLRGARDLVQPLTAANLKRATSLSGAIYGNGRTLRYDYDYDQTRSLPRELHAQQSSPHIGHDYQDRSRDWSHALPDRPYTALEHRLQYMTTPPPSLRNPQRSAEHTHERKLRTSRSYDQLGSGGGGYGAARPLHNRLSPDQNYLEPLAEDEERSTQRNGHHTPSSSINNGLGIYRPASRTSDLRDQMSSLKGKISTLKERARADSLRRQSHSNIRDQNPFNNAATTPPEILYPPSPVDDGNEIDVTPGTTPNDIIATVQPQHTFTGSRNAFAEQAASQIQEFTRARVVEVRSSKTPNSKFQMRAMRLIPQGQPQTYRRTPSGSAIVDSARSRHSHHQHNSSQERRMSQRNPVMMALPTAHIAEHEYLEIPTPELFHDESMGSSQSSSDEALPPSEEHYAPSEAESSVYEDAKEQVSVVAHEDREDAFDYEHFFLHSAMGSYSGDRSGSESSEASEASAETARGPALVGYEDDEAFDHFSGAYPPPTPGTPEKLREIERNLHRRTLSNDSATTMDTFATAEEGESYESDEEPEVSPLEERRPYCGDYMQREHSVSPLPTELRHEPASRGHYREQSYDTQGSSSTYRRGSSRQSNLRPGRSIIRHVARTDSSSDRADSGVGMTSRNEHCRPSQSGITQKPAGKISHSSAMSTPPLSPYNAMMKMDPTTVAVQALLDPNGRQLGLRNKAVLFGVVESLRKVARQMQAEDDATFASRMLRNTLDEAKRTLDGL